jgi:L-rhamnose mutarotase
MKRVGFTMKLKPGMKDEYRKRHDEIWPELVALLRESGVSDYTIFLDESSNTLFAFQRVSGEGGSQDLGAMPIVQKWWRHMSDILETNDYWSPVTHFIEEVFHMD